MDIRIANDSDYEKLRSLWQTVFGDEAGFVDNLYNSLSATGYVLAENTDVKSCLTVFDVGTYQGKAVSEIYAVCTEPSSRRNGFASKLIAHVRDEIITAGKIALICPAEESLVEFYQRLGFEPHFYTGDEFKNVEGSFDEYLGNVPHIKLNGDFAKFIEKEDPETMMQVNVGGDNVQGMICCQDKIDLDENKYPYFGFPME